MFIDLENKDSFQLISAGTSVCVYSGLLFSRQCVIKELAPVGLMEQGVIRRSKNNKIIVRNTVPAFIAWEKAKTRFMTAYKLNEMLQNDSILAPFIVPVHRCIHINGTLYSLSFEPPGLPLSEAENMSPENLLLICIRIANATARLHQLGWLMVDIKASNYILPKGKTNTAVRMTDFDSAVPIKKIRSTKRFMCSNETAAPEMMGGRKELVGTQSDVYSIAAMAITALAKHPLTDDLACLFDERVLPFIRGWRSASIEAFRNVLLSALERDPSKRTRTCEAFAAGMRKVYGTEGFHFENLFF